MRVRLPPFAPIYRGIYMRAWDDSTPTLMLFTPEEFSKLPDGTQLEAIDGEIVG